MFENKNQNNYPAEEIPETPYHQAKQEYDRRAGTYKANASNWRLMAFCLLMVSVASIASSYYFASRSTLVPYIVEVDTKNGAVLSTSKLNERSQANSKEKEYFIWQIIKKARTIPKDVVVYENNWNEVYTYLNSSSSQKLNDMALREGHKEKLINGITTMLNLQQITPISNNDNTYNVRWNEITYAPDGKKTAEYALEAYVTIQLSNSSEKTMYINPLGIMVQDFTMSKVQQ